MKMSQATLNGLYTRQKPQDGELVSRTDVHILIIIITLLYTYF